MEKKTIITVVAIVEAVRAPLAAINQGDYARAYTYLYVSVQQQMPIEDFQGYVETNASVLKTTDTTFSNRSIENNVATLRGTHTGQDGTVTPVRWTLVHQGDRWLITAFRFGDIGEDEE